jgi:hypothetical protein
LKTIRLFKKLSESSSEKEKATRKFTNEESTIKSVKESTTEQIIRGTPLGIGGHPMSITIKKLARDRAIRNRRVGNRRVGNRRVGNRRVGNRRVGNRRVGNKRVGNRRVGNRRVGNRRVGNRRVGNRRVKEI